MSAGSHLPLYGKQLAAARQFLDEHDDFLVVSHISPDGDAASSTLAVAQMLKFLKKKFTLINEGKMPRKFSRLPGFEQIIDYSSSPPQRSFDFVISVDCADFARIGTVNHLFSQNAEILNIDHHPTNDGFGSVNLIRADAASTTEVLYDLAEECRIPFNPELAECIYTGLMTDTGGFRYANTSAKVFHIAAKMLEAGAEGHVLAEQFLEKLTFAQIELLKRALSSLSFTANKKISWIVVTADEIRETGAGSEDLDGLVNYARNVEGVEVGMLFKQVDEQTVKVSLRSAGKVNVAEIAKSFGGGGHVRAAGCTMIGSVEHVVGKVVKEVGQALQ